MGTVRWKLTIEYDGRQFCGWQRQGDGVASVQQAVEEAIYAFCQQRLTIHAAGRTDAGVHAAAQVAHFDLDYGDRALSGYELAKALNAHLRPQPVSVIHAEMVAADFHARFDARYKLYSYRIINRPALLALDIGRAWHVKKPLDVAAMDEAAQLLIGHHDFTTFRDSDCQAKSPLRTLERLDVGARDYSGGSEITIYAGARSFLHHQVRNMAGSLALVGHGKWQPRDLATALAARDRTAGGPTAPPEGLCLQEIIYDAAENFAI